MVHMSATFSTSPQLFQHFLGGFHPRKLLLLAPLSQPQSRTSPPPPSNIQDPLNPNVTGDESFNSNAIMVLIVVVCALLCSPGLHSFARCALRYSNSVHGNSSARLANKGIKQKALKTFPIVNYSLERSNLPWSDTECVVCLSEFVLGDQVRILPKCSHGFHVSCIDKWLRSHSSCPKCRHCLMETCHRIAGASQASPSEQPPPLVQEITVSIAPLEREGMVSNYREVS